MCSFCDQFKITGKTKQPNEEDIGNAVKSSGLDKKTDIYKEIAFFGGSFTAIKRDYMENLLSSAYKYIESGHIDGIRISTRPDCINPKILGVLKSYGVTAIELGAQSMADSVLLANNRGHTAEDVRHSSILIKDYGFKLGLQMMTGLYMSSEGDDIYTAREFIKLFPDTVRIYPTLIMKGTKLQELYSLGNYIPMTLDEAVRLCSKLLRMFELNGINVIRLGLHASDGINENFIAGPWHPAFRELCESKIIVDDCINTIKNLNLVNRPVKISVSPKELSKVIGQRRSGLKKIKKFCPEAVIKVNPELKSRELKVEIL